MRFELWERAYALVLASKAANKYALGIGMDKIEGRVKKLAKKIRDGVNSIGGYRVLDIGPELGGIVTLTANKVQPEPLKKALDARGINTAMAPLEAAIIDFQDKQVEWAIRISPHYYNTNDEIEELLDCLKSML